MGMRRMFSCGKCGVKSFYKTQICTWTPQSIPSCVVFSPHTLITVLSSYSFIYLTVIIITTAHSKILTVISPAKPT